MFDDLEEVLGIKLQPRQKVALKELARRKNDTLRVYNPMPDDYYVDWGIYDQIEPGGSFLIPGASHDTGLGNGMSNQPRYIATKFFKEAANLILQSKQIHALKAENERRQKNGFAKLSKMIDNDEESPFLSQNGLMINHEKYLTLLPTIILGVVHEWGLDIKPMQRFTKELSLEDLQAITDREVGTDVDPSLVGTMKYKTPAQAEPVAQPTQAAPAPAPTPSDPVDPTAGVAA